MDAKIGIDLEERLEEALQITIESLIELTIMDCSHYLEL